MGHESGGCKAQGITTTLLATKSSPIQPIPIHPVGAKEVVEPKLPRGSAEECEESSVFVSPKIPAAQPLNKFSINALISKESPIKVDAKNMAPNHLTEVTVQMDNGQVLPGSSNQARTINPAIIVKEDGSFHITCPSPINCTEAHNLTLIAVPTASQNSKSGKGKAKVSGSGKTVAQPKSSKLSKQHFHPYHCQEIIPQVGLDTGVGGDCITYVFSIGGDREAVPSEAMNLLFWNCRGLGEPGQFAPYVMC